MSKLYASFSPCYYNKLPTYAQGGLHLRNAFLQGKPEGWTALHVAVWSGCCDPSGWKAWVVEQLLGATTVQDSYVKLKGPWGFP